MFGAGKHLVRTLPQGMASEAAAEAYRRWVREGWFPFALFNQPQESDKKPARSRHFDEGTLALGVCSRSLQSVFAVGLRRRQPELPRCTSKSLSASFFSRDLHLSFSAQVLCASNLHKFPAQTSLLKFSMQVSLHKQFVQVLYRCKLLLNSRWMSLCASALCKFRCARSLWGKNTGVACAKHNVAK